MIRMLPLPAFGAVATLAALAGTAAHAQPSQLDVGQSAIVYDQCLARAAVRASRTDAPDAAIYGLARDECRPIRLQLVAGRPGDAELNRVLDAIDAAKEAAFPALTQRIREQRRQREAQFQGAN